VTRGSFRMRQKLSDHEFHALYCPVKNTKSALFLVVSFSVVAFVGWKGLHKPLAPPSFVELIFVILLVAAMLAKWLVVFTCFRERLVLGLFIVSLVTGEVARSVPSVFGKHAEIIKSAKLALSLLGLLVSLSMLVQSVANPHVRPSDDKTAAANQIKRGSLILFAVIVTVLLLGAMLYFLPLQ
jgi:hypothetical protein